MATASQGSPATPKSRIKPRSITEPAREALTKVKTWAGPVAGGVLALGFLWFLLFGLGDTAAGDSALMIPVLVIGIGVALSYLAYRQGKVNEIDWMQAWGAFLVLLALNWVLYMYIPSAQVFFTTPEGRLHLGAYFVLIVIASIALGTVKGGKRTFVVIALFFIFLVMGRESNKLTDGRLLAELTGGWLGGRSSTEVRRGTVASPCNGKVVRAKKIGAEKDPINPGAQCSLGFEVVEGTVQFEGPYGDKEVWWKDKPAMTTSQLQRIVKIETARAVTASATLDYMLCPAGSIVRNWTCQ